MIQAYGKIDSAMQKRLRAIEAACMKHDGFSGSVSLDASLNVFPEMKHLFTAQEQGEPVAFLFLFVPTPQEAEVTAFTLPHHRRKGYFKALLHAAEEEMRKFGIYSLLFACNAASPMAEAVMNSLLASKVFTEYKMQYQKEPPKSASPYRLRLTRATAADLEGLTALSCSAFGDTPENARVFLEKTMRSLNRTQYAAKLSGATVGMCCILVKGQSAFLYGLGIVPELQGQGYGRELMELLLIELKKRGIRRIGLEVNSENTRALHLYQSSGFEVFSANDYYRLKI